MSKHNQYKCVYCPQTFDSAPELDLHRRAHIEKQESASRARELEAMGREADRHSVGPLQGHADYWQAERDYRRERRLQHAPIRLSTVKSS